MKGSGQTILIADDDQPIRDLLCSALAKMNYRAIPAKDGPEALTKAATEKSVDLLLTDVTMPGMDGQTLAGKLVEFFPDIRVVFMSGYAESDTELEVKGLHQRYFIQKPVPLALLFATLSDIFKGGSSG